MFIDSIINNIDNIIHLIYIFYLLMDHISKTNLSTIYNLTIFILFLFIKEIITKKIISKTKTPSKINKQTSSFLSSSSSTQTDNKENEKSSLFIEIQRLKDEKENLSFMNDYVKVAKIEREIKKLTFQLNQTCFEGSSIETEGNSVLSLIKSQFNSTQTIYLIVIKTLFLVFSLIFYINSKNYCVYIVKNDFLSMVFPTKRLISFDFIEIGSFYLISGCYLLYETVKKGVLYII